MFKTEKAEKQKKQKNKNENKQMVKFEKKYKF
jgi:hypothetical protein